LHLPRAPHSISGYLVLLVSRCSFCLIVTLFIPLI
jgi:hypothetical protein